MPVYRRYICKCRAKYYHNPGCCPRCGGTKFTASSPIMRIYTSGKPKDITAKGCTMAQARRRLKRIEGEAAAGGPGAFEEKHWLMSEYIEKRYWPLHGKNLRSSRNYRYNLDAHIIPTFGESWMHRITQADVIGWRNELEDRGLSPAAVQRLVDLLAGIFTKANKWGDCRFHPVSGLERLEEANERGDEYLLTPGRFKSMTALCDNPILRAAITLAIATCLRKQNLFGLRRDRHVDMKRRQIKIPGSESKNKQPVVIPMTDLIYRELCEVPMGLYSPYVLHVPQGQKKKLWSDWKELRAKMAEADPDFPAGFHWHDLRATGISWLVMAGVPDRTIMRIANLKSSRVLSRYTHLSDEHVLAEMEKVRGNFEEEDIGVLKTKGG